MKKVKSFSLKEQTIAKITTIGHALGISRSRLLDMEIDRRLSPLMPLVERILKDQVDLKRRL